MTYTLMMQARSGIEIPDSPTLPPNYDDVPEWTIMELWGNDVGMPDIDFIYNLPDSDEYSGDGPDLYPRTPLPPFYSSPEDNSLWIAVYTNNIPGVYLALKSDANVNASPNYDYPNKLYIRGILEIAALQGNPEMVQLLLDTGAEDKHFDTYFGTAVVAAAYAGHVDILDKLLKEGFNPNTKVDYCESPLIAAAMMGETKTVEMLLSYGADVNGTGYNDKTTALIAAAGSERTDTRLGMVRILLEAGAEVNALVGVGVAPNRTALQAAMFSGGEGFRRVVEVLLCAGATPMEQRDKDCLAMFVRNIMEDKPRGVGWLVKTYGIEIS
jgi:hypothetical protein